MKKLFIGLAAFLMSAPLGAETPANNHLIGEWVFDRYECEGDSVIKSAVLKNIKTAQTTATISEDTIKVVGVFEDNCKVETIESYSINGNALSLTLISFHATNCQEEEPAFETGTSHSAEFALVGEDLHFISTTYVEETHVCDKEDRRLIQVFKKATAETK